jgi:hypothetical protein
MSGGFWSLRNAPAWWFSKRAWKIFAVAVVAMLVARWEFGPGRVPDGKVVFYGAPWCAYSQALSQYLADSNIPYERRDIDASALDFVRFWFASGSRRGGGLPVVQVGPKVVAKGFYRADIARALEAAGYHPVDRAPGPDGYTEPR